MKKCLYNTMVRQFCR